MASVFVAEYFFEFLHRALDAFVQEDGILKPVLDAAIAARCHLPFKFKFEVGVFTEREKVFVDPGFLVGFECAIFNREGIAGYLEFAEITPAGESLAVEDAFGGGLREAANGKERCDAENSFHRRLSYTKQTMTQREIIEKCIGTQTVTLTMRSGVIFRGVPISLEAEQVRLQLAGDDSAWILLSEIAALTLHEKQAEAQHAPKTESEFREQAVELYERMALEFTWASEPPRPSELKTAWEMFGSIAESLRALSVDAYMRNEIESQIQLIRLVSSGAGRFRISGGVLEAGFIENEPVLAPRELQSLLAAIL